VTSALVHSIVSELSMECANCHAILATTSTWLDLVLQVLQNLIYSS